MGFDLGPVLTEGGRNVPHGCPASLAPLWEGEQVAESPYQKFMQVRRPLLTSCMQRCGCLNDCGPSHLKLHSIACKESHRASNEEGLRLRPELLPVHVWYIADVPGPGQAAEATGPSCRSLPMRACSLLSRLPS